MKTNIRIVLSSVAILAIASSCSKVVEMSNPEEVNQKVTICASIPEDGMETKALLSQPDGVKSAIKVAWESTDQITVNGNVFTVESITNGGKTALFSGNNPGAAPYTISFSGFDSVNEQTQSQDASLDHLKYAASIAGADSYSNMSFSSAWASAHGATLTVSSVLELRAKLPDAIAPEVQKVIFSFPEEISTGNKRIVVNLDTKGVQSADKILDVYATLPAGNINLPNILVQFQVSNNAYEKYSAYREFDPSTVIVGGTTQYLGLDCSNIESYANANSTNIGESTNPYLVGDKYQMNYLHTAMQTGTTYVKMVDDVDLNNEEWTPLNIGSPYDKGVDFNGNDKTISRLTVTGTADGYYASFAGVLNGAIYNVTFDSATITSNDGKSGVVAGYLGSGTTISASVQHVTVKNSSVTNTAQYTGGIAGIAQKLSTAIDDCHVINTTVTGKTGDAQDSRVGGLLGQLNANLTCSNSTAQNVTISGSKNVGGLIGVAYGRVETCSSSGAASSTNTTNKTDIALGGLVGFFETGTITKCSSSVIINQTSGARSIGGLIGLMKAATLEKSYSTGNVTTTYRNVGGLIGLVTNTSGTAVISDCYSTGNVEAAAFIGGLIGLFEKGTAVVSRCFASGVISGSFGLGGLIGNTGEEGITVQDCASWNSSVTASSIGHGNWSSGAVIGVTFPSATVTNNYRNPGMKLTAYWGTEEGYACLLANDYDHADVSPSSKLIKQNGDHTTATSCASGQDDYPQFPYNGHYTAETKLTNLAKTAKVSGGLGWSDTVWNFPDVTPFLPTLK